MFGPAYVIVGVGVATVISRGFYLFTLTTKSNKLFNIKVEKLPIFKSIFAASVMGVFLKIFNYYIDMNLFLGVIEVISGAIIYVLVLFLIKGLTKEDFEVINLLRK